MRPRPAGVFNTTKQMALVFCAFAAVIALVESHGLAVWAERLEIGPLRAVAIPVTAAWHRLAQPLGIELLRDTAIADLQKVGWSDEPAQPAAADANADVKASDALPAPPQPLGPPLPIVERPLIAAVPQATVLPPLPSRPETRPRVVALAGDSMMAVGLSAVLLRETARRKDLHIVKAFRSGTGLTRPEVFDWMRQYPAMLGDERPDVVLVAIGANDGQGFVEAGKVLPFGSEPWIAVYRKRSNQFLDMLAANGARVVWIGLPPMKEPGYNQRIETINRIAFTVAAGHTNTSWWNPTPYIGDAGGRFREFLTTANGKTIRLRGADGIHLSDDGAALVISQLLQWLDETREPLGPPARQGALR